MKPSLALGAIGNCAVSALVDARAGIVWSCMPRPDGDPVFHALLGGDEPTSGLFAVELEGWVRSEQTYEPNTAVLRTRLYDGAEQAVEVTDFAPRFISRGRMYRPVMLVRRVRVLAGMPRIRIRVRPGFDWGREAPRLTQGSHHVRYVVEWQEAVIRAAITLKLCVFEDTGAIVAALTTSTPEAPRSQRNWDYRYQAFEHFQHGVYGNIVLGAAQAFHDRRLLQPGPAEFGHLEAVGEQAVRVYDQPDAGPYMRRYEAPDDFGSPEAAFDICSFWRIDALARIGRRAQAREAFEAMLAARNPLGLMSEDTDAVTGRMWGNFPQTYSMVGIINGAVRLSLPWDAVI